MKLKRLNLLSFILLSFLLIKCIGPQLTCIITNPLEGDEINKGDIVTISVDAESLDADILEVKLFIDEIGKVSLNSFPYNYEWDTWDENFGEHIIRVKVIDSNGEQTETGIRVTIIDNNVPEAISNDATSIGTKTATLNGEIGTMGSNLITECGFHWSQNSKIPDVNDSICKLDLSSPFSYRLKNLKPNTTYYFRAFCANNNGVGFGETLSFTTLRETASEITDSTFVDERDNHTYRIIEIGNQVWMAENLAYLPEVSPTTSQSETEPIYYVNGYAGNNADEAKLTENYLSYGVLYNWAAASQACPTGWHLPSEEEWKQLAEYISEDNGGYDFDDFKWENIGKHLKATSGWHQEGNGTDDYGFNALAAGYRRIYDGGFTDPGENGYWWSNFEQSDYAAYYYGILFDKDYLFKYAEDKMYGMSVRCIKSEN